MEDAWKKLMLDVERLKETTARLREALRMPEEASLPTRMPETPTPFEKRPNDVLPPQSINN